MLGQQLFLASSVQLQEVLLPRLPAADLLRLGLTCKGLLSWVTSMPPAYWQVIPAPFSSKSCSVQLPARKALPGPLAVLGTSLFPPA